MPSRPAGAADTARTWTEVHELLAAYLDAVDGADLDRVADLLAEASVVTPGGVLTGREEIRATYERLQPVPHEDGRRRTKHHLTNLVVSHPEPDGSAVADAYYFVLEAAPDGSRVLKSGRFHERLERRRDRWVIREHHVIADF